MLGGNRSARRVYLPARWVQFSLSGIVGITIWKHGKNFRIDASASRGLHYHYRNAVGGISAHRTAGIFEAVGGIAGIASLFD